MIFNCIDYKRDTTTPKNSPYTKSIHVINDLITMFTDIGDVVIDPWQVAELLFSCRTIRQKSYGFEIKKEYVKAFNDTFKNNVQITLTILRQIE